MAHRRLTAVASGLIALGLVGPITGCSDSTQRTAFQDPSGFTQWLDVTPGSLVDVGLPLLHNVTGQEVRVVDMQWPDKPGVVTVLGVKAVPYAESDGGIGLARGTVESLFPAGTPRPVASAVTRPHADSDWMVLMTVRLGRRANTGTIPFEKARVEYTAAGRTYWQFLTLNAELRVMKHLPS